MCSLDAAVILGDSAQDTALGAGAVRMGSAAANTVALVDVVSFAAAHEGRLAAVLAGGRVGADACGIGRGGEEKGGQGHGEDGLGELHG